MRRWLNRLVNRRTRGKLTEDTLSIPVVFPRSQASIPLASMDDGSAYLFFSALFCSPLDSDMLKGDSGRDSGSMVFVMVAVFMIQISPYQRWLNQPNPSSP